MTRLLAILFVLSTAATLSAQETSTEPPSIEKAAKDGAPKENTVQLLEQVMLARISRELSIDDEQTVLIVRRFADYRETAREARQQRGKLLRELDEALKKSESSDGIEEKVRALQELELQMAREKNRHFDLVSAQLTPWQRGKLYLFLADFERELHRMVRHAKEKQEGQSDRPDKLSAPEKENTNLAPAAPAGEK